MTEHSTHASRNTARAQRAMGAMFFFPFGGAWLGLWAFFTFASRWPALIAIAIASLGLLLIAYRVYLANTPLEAVVETPAEQRRSLLFNLVNAGQWLLIVIVANVLVKLDMSVWILPAIIFIVGLHFVPLAVIFANPPHYLTALALMLLAVLYPFINASGGRNAVGCLGAGLILWASAAWAVSPYSSKVAATQD